VDAVDLAASIAWQRPMKHWRVPIRHGAQIAADHYHAVIAAGNLAVDDIDGELFALDAALATDPLE
jgi:hypothetical protein